MTKCSSHSKFSVNDNFRSFRGARFTAQCLVFSACAVSIVCDVPSLHVGVTNEIDRNRITVVWFKEGNNGAWTARGNDLRVF